MWWIEDDLDLIVIEARVVYEVAGLVADGWIGRVRRGFTYLRGPLCSYYYLYYYYCCCYYYYYFLLGTVSTRSTGLGKACGVFCETLFEGQAPPVHQ